MTKGAIVHVFALFGCMALVACGNETPSEEPPAVSPRAPIVAPKMDEKKKDAPVVLTPKVETETYVIELKVVPKKGDVLTVGVDAKVAVRLRPKNGWHVNEEFPSALSLAEVDGLAFEHRKVDKKLAKRFDKNGADFEVSVNPAAPGPKRIVADVSFAVCTEQTCLPENLTLAHSIEVEAGEIEVEAGEVAP